MTSVASQGPVGPKARVDHLGELDSRGVYEKLNSLLGVRGSKRLSNSGEGGDVSTYIRHIPGTEGEPESIELRAGRISQPNDPISCWIFRSDGRVTMGQVELFGQKEMINIAHPPNISLTEVLEAITPSAASAAEATRMAVDGTLRS